MTPGGRKRLLAFDDFQSRYEGYVCLGMANQIDMGRGSKRWGSRLKVVERHTMRNTEAAQIDPCFVEHVNRGSKRHSIFLNEQEYMSRIVIEYATNYGLRLREASQVPSIIRN